MLNQLFVLSTLLVAILSFGLGLFSLYKNPKAKVVWLWFLSCVSVGVWSLSLYIVITTENYYSALFFDKFLHTAAAFIPIFFSHFVLVFLLKDNNKRLFIWIGYLLAIILAVLSFTPLIVTGVASSVGFRFWVAVGPLYPIFLIYFWVYVLAAIYFLYQGFLQSGGVMRRKIFYILLAAIFSFAGGGMNFLPQTIGVFPYGEFLTLLYPILITYGIFIDEIKIRF